MKKEKHEKIQRKTNSPEQKYYFTFAKIKKQKQTNEKKIKFSIKFNSIRRYALNTTAYNTTQHSIVQHITYPC